MASKQDFTKVAELLKAKKPDPKTAGEEACRCWREIVVGMADILAEKNARFDYARFYAACGFES